MCHWERIFEKDTIDRNQALPACLQMMEEPEMQGLYRETDKEVKQLYRKNGNIQLKFQTHSHHLLAAHAFVAAPSQRRFDHV